LWINDSLKQICQNHGNSFSNTNIDTNFFENKTALNLTSFNNSAFQKPLPQTQFSNKSSNRVNQRIFNTNPEHKYFNSTKNTTTTESLIDKLTVMNCAPTPNTTTDFFTTENFTTDNFKTQVPDTFIADESLVESSDIKSPSHNDMEHVVDKCVRKNKTGRIKNAENSESETDSDVYIESYKDQAKANQTDCLGDDELSESEKRTKRTTKSLKSSRFKKRYSKKQVNL